MESKIYSKLLHYVFSFILFSSIFILNVLNNNKLSPKFSSLRILIGIGVLLIAIINLVMIQKSSITWQPLLIIVGLWIILLYSIADVWYFIVIGIFLIIPAYALITLLKFEDELEILTLEKKNYVRFHFPVLTQPIYHIIISSIMLFLYYIFINASITNIPFIFDLSESELRNPINLYGTLSYFEPDDFADYMYNLAILHRLLIIVFIFICQLKLYTMSPISDKHIFGKVKGKNIYYYEFFIYFLGFIDILFTTYDTFLLSLIKYLKNETNWHFVADDFPALVIYFFQVILLTYIIYKYSNKLRIIKKIIK